MIFGILIFIILYISTSGSILITTFNNSLTTENLSFLEAGNITRYLDIPRYSNVTSAYLNLSGYTGAWDIQSVTYDNINISTQQGSPEGIFFKPDGTKLFEICWGDSEDSKIYQLSCSDAWNLSSCSYDAVSILSQDSHPKGLFFKPDGTKLFEIGWIEDKIYQYS